MLTKGDALFWSSDLIHGSLPPQSPGLSRNSLTAHYVGDSHPFTVYGGAIDFTSETHHGMKLCVTREAKHEKSPT
jgi:ectoine hydroxylase-related dioxygenase (phytanoyl-CoA dioxygenase family)